MKKILSALFLSLLLTASSVGAQENFKIVKIPQEFNNDSWKLVARYKDTKEPINLSTYYDGYVFATVPAENAEREIEAFIPDEVQFTDYSPEHYQFHMMGLLAEKGVIKGNEKGEAKPFDNVTRAEATAMIMRFIGLDAKSEGSEPFEDVNEGDWFYNSVVTAYNAGIIVGDSETTFSPERDVTREEMTVMTARAMNYAELGYSGSSQMEPVDKATVSDWAQFAYEMIRGNAASDVDFTDPNNPRRALNPQKSATRYDVAYTLFNVTQSLKLYAVWGVKGSAANASTKKKAGDKAKSFEIEADTASLTPGEHTLTYAVKLSNKECELITVTLNVGGDVASETVGEGDSSGCKSSVGIGSALALMACIGGASLVLKKKKEDQVRG